MHKATLLSDGGARGNPGPAGIGFVLVIAGKPPIRHSEYIGEATNNQAEYKALIAGLQRARDEGVTDITCYLDSELVVQQLRGEYRVKNEGLKPLFNDVESWRNQFRNISFHHVVRAKNKQADKLVNKAIDETVSGRLTRK